MANGRVLLAEDDDGLAELMRYHLERAGFRVTHTRSGDEALLLAREDAPDLVLLDWMMEGLSGLEVCRHLRRLEATANIPIIMITARAEEADRVRGLDTGADDYIGKPFSPREMIARITAVLRRVRPALAGAILEFEDLTVDVSGRRVARAGAAVQLTASEFRLLRLFMENPGRVFSRENILDRVWGPDTAVGLRTVDVQVRRLRSALNAGGRPDLFRTVRGAGYSLDRPAPL